MTAGIVQTSVVEQTTERPTIQIGQAQVHQTIARMLAEKQANGTSQLDKNKLDQIPNFSMSPYGLNTDLAAGFLPLPTKPDSRRETTWLIELQGLGRQSIGIHVLGDVVLGISRPPSACPDLDLSQYAGEDKGVSRRHAVLRPSQNRLYVIDLQSTNGTRVNMMPVNAGIAKELRNNDSISLGALTFTLKIIATPEQLDSLRSGRNA